MSEPLYGLIEAGGTKFVLGTARNPQEVVTTTRVPTTTPAETIDAVLDWFGGQPPLAAIGLASFGPIELDRTSPHWGHILATPKPGWNMTDLAGPLVRHFGCPLELDTDVNGAALAESLWGAGAGQRSVVYLTVGTGIGGGAVIDGKTLRGLSHPEMGHLRVPRHEADRGFAGVCRFHGDCLEGLASGPSVVARYGCSLSQLPADHSGHEIVAWYLAHAAIAIQAILEPARIILGGGVMHTPGLIGRITACAVRAGAGYFRGDPQAVIVPPGLGDRAGLLGALALAQGAS